ncbi:E3 ubiquitin-protein ligase UHRF1 [Portunus trituberculatus]|uniref:E3 ubiquitin-protein ligase UHRF1 n=1 Tax=Portunus trituberculatus TaxID=210409 RepID=A0A5B7HJI0_PORTR|nr:E3 ubiquitin-protein ligase UHRF1 [Portunus trituberculatus]
MYVKVKSMDGTQTAVLTISKLTTIDDFRGMVEEKLKIAKDRQRLFYRGKQHRLDICMALRLNSECHITAL